MALEVEVAELVALAAICKIKIVCSKYLVIKIEYLQKCGNCELYKKKIIILVEVVEEELLLEQPLFSYGLPVHILLLPPLLRIHHPTIQLDQSVQFLTNCLKIDE